MLAHDTETNPGPASNDLCGICTNQVKWYPERGIYCEECSTWFHAECQGLSTFMYQFHSDHPDESWECNNCGMPNFSSSLFESSSIADSNQSLHSLSSISSNSESVQSPGLHAHNPLHSSTPTKSRLPNTNPRQHSANFHRKQNLQHLKIISVNCQSVKKKNLGFMAMMYSVMPDIVLGNESWLKPHIKNSEVFPPEFDVYRHDRKRRTGGGVFILVSKKFKSHCPVELKSDSELLWVSIKQKGKKDLYVCSAYRPDKDTDCIDELCRTISLVDCSNSSIVLGGDFNLGDINWQTNSVMPGASRAIESQKLLDLSVSFSLTQLVNEDTRLTDTTSSCLDLIFVSNPSLVENVKVIPGFSDHCIPFVDMLSSVRLNQKAKRTIYLFDKANWFEIKNGILDFGSKINSSNVASNVQSLWDAFKSKLDELVTKHVPTKVLSGKQHLPWLNAKVRKLMKKRDRLYCKNKKRKSSSISDKLKKIKKLIQKETRQAYWNHMNNIICDPTENKHGTTKRFWGFIKSLRNDSCGVAPLRDKGILKSNADDKAEILNKQFTSVFTKGDNPYMPDLGDSPYPSMPDIQVTETGVRKLLMNLNIHKAAGPDGIRPRLLKECATEIAPIFTKLFNISLTSGTVPSEWTQALVTPIFKKGEKFIASNYRPVSLTCIACKMLEHIVVSNVLDHLDLHSILVDNQHGFRARRSCETQLTCFIHDLASSIQKSQVDVAIMDFSKAFDVVHHSSLLYKADHYGVRGSTNSWIGAFLSSRTQQVVVDGARSEKSSVASGVPQGSVLGPLLFLLYINDLPSRVRSHVRLFADDCVIYREIRSDADSHQLQRDLDSLAVWEQEWKMSFNISKCHIMHISRSKKVIRRTYTLNGQPMSPVDQATYLGVELSSDLTWGPHVAKVTSKASQTLGFLKRNIHSAKPETKQAAYNSLVRPVLEYSSSAWDPYNLKDINKLEGVQRKAARFVTNNYDKSPGTVTNILKDLHWESLQSRRQNSRLVLLHKIVYHYIDIPTTQYLTPYTRHSRHFHHLAFHLPITTSDYFKYSFFPRTVVVWNTLPSHVVSADTVLGFRSALATVSLP